MTAAIVTGAASGVGAATVARLAANGEAVVGVDRAWAETGVAADGVERVAGDVTDDGAWAAAVEAADRHGGASKLVLNAAHLVLGTILDGPEEDVRAVLEVNVMGAVKGLRAVLPGMIARGGGTVVAVASTNAMYAEQDLAAYCTSKGALLQLVRCVAVDHARAGIRANVVCPAAVETPFFMQHVENAPDPQAFLRQKTERHPAGRLLRPEDVAEVVCFLLDGASIGMTGTPVLVDGGLTASYDFVVEG